MTPQVTNQTKEYTFSNNVRLNLTTILPTYSEKRYKPPSSFSPPLSHTLYTRVRSKRGNKFALSACYAPSRVRVQRKYPDGVRLQSPWISRAVCACSPGNRTRLLSDVTGVNKPGATVYYIQLIVAVVATEGLFVLASEVCFDFGR